MSHTNGNGKIDPSVVTAQQATEAAIKPLKEAEKRAATTRLRLEEAQSALALAEQDNSELADRLLDDPSEANKRALIASNAEVEVARSRVRGFKGKLVIDEKAIAPLREIYDAAMVQLAEAQTVANIAHLRQEKQSALDEVVRLTEKLARARSQYAEVDTKLRSLEQQRREADWRQQKAAAAEHWKRSGNAEPGITRMRVGF